MSFDKLGELETHSILSRLDATTTAKVACVSGRFRVSTSDDSLWARYCSEELDLTTPLDPSFNPSPSFKEAYQAWRTSFGMYPWSLVTRVKRFWDNLKHWLQINFPEVLQTLRDGASEEVLNQFEINMGVKLPVPSRVLYRFCDGQEQPRNKLWGIIGGYSFYDHLVNVSLLPLSQIIMETRAITNDCGFPSRSKFIVVAASTTYSEKFFFLNCVNGQVYVGTKNLREDGEMIPCVPDAAVSSIHGYRQQEAMLLWLEEHGRRLRSGTIGTRRVFKRKSINLFPLKAPHCSTAVTSGVQVTSKITHVCDVLFHLICWSLVTQSYFIEVMVLFFHFQELGVLTKFKINCLAFHLCL
ncbi:F-box protein skip16 [Dionaea muscipula]